MPTTIEGTFNRVESETISFNRKVRRFGRKVFFTVEDGYRGASRVVNPMVSKVVDKAAKAATDTARWAKEDALPAAAHGADKAVSAVDGVCTTANKAAVNFLVKYPGIAMTLSPQTIVRMAVAEHYKEMAGQPAADGHRVGDAIENAEHIAVNIMQ
jgi:hypothetical protein